MTSPALDEQRKRVRQELIGREYRILTAPDGPPDAASVRAAVNDSTLSVLFHDRSAAVNEPAAAAAAVEREVALDLRAKQIIVVHGSSGGGSQPWDEPAAAGFGSANVEWLIEPPIHKLYHTVLEMLGAQLEGAPAESAPPPDDQASRTVAAQDDAGQQPPPSATLAPVLPDGQSLGADAAGPRKLVRIYLVCDRDDNPLGLREPNRALHLRNHLLNLGFEVKLPLADQDDSQFARDNRNKLKVCDAVLLYWGTAGQRWFEKRIEELDQARGWRRGKAFAARGAYVADPAGPVKENYKTRELDELIKQLDGLDLGDAQLKRFVARVEQFT